MVIDRIHNQQIDRAESEYLQRFARREVEPPPDPQALEFDADFGGWKTRNKEGNKLKRSLGNGQIGIGAILRSGAGFVEVQNFREEGEPELIIIPSQQFYFSMVITRFLPESPPISCDKTRWNFNGCFCSANCNTGDYATGEECAADNELTALWITVANDFVEAVDGSCRYEPNGGYLFCDEDPNEKFPGYQTVTPPNRISYQAFSAVGWYRTSATPAFDTGWSPADAAANGWQRFIPGNIYQKDGTTVIFVRSLASQCDSPPGIPGLPGSVGVPPALGGGTATQWTTTGSPVLNSFSNSPYSSATDPGDPPPTKPAVILPEAFTTRRIEYQFGRKMLTRLTFDIPGVERVSIFTTSVNGKSYMVLRTGIQDDVSNDFCRIRIFQNEELISETVNPVLPDLAELGVDGLWNAAYISYDNEPTPPADPCGEPPIEFINLYRSNRLYLVDSPLPDLNNPAVNPKEFTIRAFQRGEVAGNCTTDLLKIFTKEITIEQETSGYTFVAASYFPSSSDP